MIRAFFSTAAVLALGLAMPALAAPPKKPAARPMAQAMSAGQPIFIRTSLVHAAPPSEINGETFPGQIADDGSQPMESAPLEEAREGTLLWQVAMARSASPAPARRPARRAEGTLNGQLAMAKAKPTPAASPAKAATSSKSSLSASDWRELDPDNALVIDTTKGRVIVELLPEAAPQHVQRIKELTKAGFYDGQVFFRVIDQFMAQTGDPQNTGEGGSERGNLKAEFTFRRTPEMPFVAAAKPMGLEVGFIRSTPIVSQSSAYFAILGNGSVASWATYCPGVAGMARDDDPDSANSQFFIMRQAYPSLDKRYTVWGRAVSGLEAVRAIKTGEPVVDPDKMTKVRILADIPEAERPKVKVIDTASAGFKALLERTRAARGADFSVCDVDLPVQVIEPRTAGGGAKGPAA